jgi:uncharacterized protein YkwD
MSAKRSTTLYGGVVAAVLVTFVISQCADGSTPSAIPSPDVTVVDVVTQPPVTESVVSDPPLQSSTAPASTVPATSTTTTSVVVITTTTVPFDQAAAGPAEAGVAAPVRGEQFQLTEPIPAPATTTTTEPPPPPTTRPPAEPQPQPTQPPTSPTTQPPEPPPTQPPVPPPASTSNDAITLTNQARANAGLAPLSANAALNSAAAAHSADQAARNLMTHTGSNGSNAGDRIRAAGYQPSTWGENVAAGYSSASSVVAGWMGSSGHRANILNPAFTQIGVASATSANGTRYWTMVLAG